VTVADYVEATATRERIRAGFARLFAGTDLLLTPIASLAPERSGVGAQSFRDGVLPFTVPQDLAGLPSCAVPVGFDDLGLPVGVQLTGPPWSEARVLAAAEELFSATASARAGFVSSR
jgi:aspartyl-tRNA(Asn)/glutamyl-tRNA(Gln) amidotransferase subunit A